MPIQRLLEGSDLAPSEKKHLSLAYETALRELRLVDRTDPVTELVARKIIELGADAGDPVDTAKLALRSFGIKE